MDDLRKVCNKSIMVGESLIKATEECPSNEIVQDVGYSSESSVQLSNDEERGSKYSPVRCLIEEAERLVRTEIKDKWNEVEDSCDASGEYTTNESEVENTSEDLEWTVKTAKNITPYGGSVETVVPSAEERTYECRRIRRNKKRDRPRSMTELYRRCSPDVPFFRSEVELNGLLSPTLSYNRIKSSCSYPRLSRRRLQRSFTTNTLSQLSDNYESERKQSNSSSWSNCSPVRKFSLGLSSIEPIQIEDNQCDSDPDVTLKATEDLSSVSDQVWDGYQDPLYLSEPYSELTVDEDDFKKVTEYGDDYCNVIGVESDPVQNTIISPIKHRTNSQSPDNQLDLSDSDSDLEDFHCIIKETRTALQFAKATLKENCIKDQPSSSIVCTELVATCNTHLHCLQLIGDHLQRGRVNRQFTKRDQRQIQGLIRDWEMIQNAVDQPEDCNDDQKLEEIRKQLICVRQTMVDSKQDYCSPPHSSFEDLEKRIQTLQVSLCALQETREQLLAVNLQVRRQTASSLKDEVTELYRQWDDIYEHNNSHLTDLQTIHSQWIDYENKYKRLKNKLQREDTIEDDQDDYDMEKQLKELRHLAEGLRKNLEGAEAWQNISDGLEELQDEISRLQESEEAFEDSTSDQDSLNKAETKKGPSMFWRVLRAAIPIQLALVMLYCIACLLEPHCCDFVNNFNFSFTPHLRYIRGPPPV